MPTYSDEHGFNRGKGIPAIGTNRISLVEVEMDFAKITAKRSEVGATALRASDKLQVIDIPAHTQVTNVGMRVVSAESSAATVDIGDDSDPDGYLNDANVSAVSGFSNTQGTVGYGNGKYYATDDTIDLVMSAALKDCKIVVWAEVAVIG